MQVDLGIRCLIRSIFCKVASLIEIEIFTAVILVAMVRIFIKYRDKVNPWYQINIGINSVKGFDEKKVKEAFSKYKVIFTSDKGVEWGNSLKGITKCDAREGVIFIRSNGDCTTCCFDFDSINKFGNIFEDSIEELNKKLNETEFELCKRCDFERP